MVTEERHTIVIALGLDDMYEHKAALGAIRFAKTREDWQLSGAEWLSRRRRDRRRVDGIIARITSSKELERLKSHQVPVVDIAGSIDDPDVITVLNDDRLTGYMAGRHLLARGLEAFFFLGVEGETWSDKRLDGLRDALSEAAGEVRLIERRVDRSWLERGGNLAELAEWAGKLPRPCGVFAANDNLGYKAIAAAALAGLSVPDDLAVIGVDNDEAFCELALPPMTSIPCDCEKIGAEAAGALCAALRGERSAGRTVIAPWPVVTRSSTDIRIGDDQLIRDVKNFIRQNVGKGINVADVVAAFPLSRRALEMRFNRPGGRTLHDEIRAVRLEKACRLLEEGRNATEAAIGSGFATNQHFHHVFKKYMRMTPTAYSNRVGKREASKARRSEAAFLPIAPV